MLRSNECASTNVAVQRMPAANVFDGVNYEVGIKPKVFPLGSSPVFKNFFQLLLQNFPVW
jgi:hypothetical protein